MRKVMVDIETLGHHADSVVLSIGAVEFTDDSLGESFHTFVDIDSCLKYGLTVSGSTITWWMGQSEEARRHFDKKGSPLPEALLQLSQFIGEGTQVWANGANFDCVILENAYRACEKAPPWAYYNVMDYRTLKNLIPKELFDTLRVRPEIAHDALSDAKAQAETLIAILKLR